MRQKRLKVIDLFTGIGGILLGFEQAGFETVSANEIDSPTVEMLRHNYPHLYINDRSIENISGLELLNGLKVGELDVLAGGPPCQGFSLIGLRDEKDSRNGLVSHFIRMIKEIKPKTFLMENVPGMISACQRKFFPALLDELDKAGYDITPPQILNADDFGVPQNRSRVFIMGTRKDLKIIINYPSKTHLSPRAKSNGNGKNLTLFPSAELPRTPTVRDAIDDLINVDKYAHLVDGDGVPYTKKPKSDYSKMMRGLLEDPNDLSRKIKWDKNYCTGCKRTVHGVGITGRINETKPGDMVPISRLYRLKWDDVANTLRAGTPRERGSYSSPRPIHPEYPRVVTVREGARLQSFPDWIRFHPTKWHGFRQVGNSVPPLLARNIAMEFKKALQ